MNKALKLADKLLVYFVIVYLALIGTFFLYVRAKQPYATAKVRAAQKTITYLHGDPQTELTEQGLVAEFVSPNDYVLELGTNVGLCSLMAAYYIHDSSHLVSSESDPSNAKMAVENRNINNFKYTIVPAISKKRIIQKKNEWFSKIIDADASIPNDWQEVPTVSLDIIKKLSKVDKFDTLIVDCEGCGTAVLAENPEILQNAKKVIYEHDETIEQEYLAVLDNLKINNFTRVKCVANYTAIGVTLTQMDCFHAVYLKPD